MKENYNNTNADFDKSLKSYFFEINAIPMMSVEEEVELATKMKNGDKIAYSKIILSNLRFVVSVAKEFRGCGLPFNDLINEGNLGLIEAANRFDVTRGCRFITYAVWWIKQSILQALTNHTRVVRLPVNQQNNLNKLAKTQESLEQKHKRSPSLSEIASALNLSDKEMSAMFKLEPRQVSLDFPLDEIKQLNCLELIHDDNIDIPDLNLEKEALQFELYEVLNVLSDREAEVICMYFGLYIENSLTLEEIAAKYKLSRERIRQIKENALLKLRRKQKSQKLMQYF